MKDTNELNLEIEKIKGDIKLINQSSGTKEAQVHGIGVNY